MKILFASNTVTKIEMSKFCIAVGKKLMLVASNMN